MEFPQVRENFTYNLEKGGKGFSDGDKGTSLLWALLHLITSYPRADTHAPPRGSLEGG